jgi:capsular polysaccharide biosynthesis protein
MQKSLLHRVGRAIRNQWTIVTVIVGLGIAVAALMLVSTHAKFMASTYVLMVAGSGESSGGSGPAVSSASQPLTASDLPQLATAATVISRVRDDVHEQAPVDVIKSRIRARVSTESSIMELDYTANTADKAVLGANVLATEITNFYRDLATTRFDALITDLKTQLSARRAELARLDGDLADISKSYPYIDAKTPNGGDGESVYQRLIALRTERDELQSTLRADQAEAQATRGLIANTLPSATRAIVQADAMYARVREQYTKDAAELQRISAFGSPQYPGLTELRRTVAREGRQVDAALRQAARISPATDPSYASALDAVTKADAQVAADEAKVNEDSNALLALHAQIGRSSIATTAARLRRDHDNAEAAYAIIAGRLANSIADRAEAASTGSLVTLESAQFAAKTSTANTQAAAFGLVALSIWLAITIALMIENNDEWFTDDHTIETVYGAPVIGSLI